MATYIVKSDVLENASTSDVAHLKALRLSDNSIDGTVETLESDVILPNTRVKSVPEVGSESSSGSLECEWNIDEQDDLIASALCGTWNTVEEEITETVLEYKELVLGTQRDIYTMVKYFDQAPKEWQVYTGIQVNQMSITMALNSFVKMSFDVIGGNNPVGVAIDPYSDDTKYVYDSALNTKAFKTLAGSLKVGGVPMRQSPNFDISINNNKEATHALFETEAIEMSDGDFEVSGNLEVWKADEKGMDLKNDAIKGVDKKIEVEVYRDWIDEGVSKRTSYTISLDAHFQDPSEAKDGNKFKLTIPYSVNVENGIKFIKKVVIN